MKMCLIIPGNINLSLQAETFDTALVHLFSQVIIVLYHPKLILVKTAIDFMQMKKQSPVVDRTNLQKSNMFSRKFSYE